MAGILGTGTKQDTLEICIGDTLDLLERLAEYYETPSEAAKWLRSPQGLLNNETPEKLIAQGKASELHKLWDTIDDRGFL